LPLSPVTLRRYARPAPSTHDTFSVFTSPYFFLSSAPNSSKKACGDFVSPVAYEPLEFKALGSYGAHEVVAALD
jgi:hypothetical protein